MISEAEEILEGFGRSISCQFVVDQATMLVSDFSVIVSDNDSSRGTTSHPLSCCYKTYNIMKI